MARNGAQNSRHGWSAARQGSAGAGTPRRHARPCQSFVPNQQRPRPGHTCPGWGSPCCEGWWARRGVSALLVVAAMRGLVCWLCVLLQRCWWCVRASRAAQGCVTHRRVHAHMCITSAEGVCCSNVCAQTCIPLCKKCVVYMCVCTHVPLSAEGVCRSHVCAHTCIPLCKSCMSCISVCAHASHFTGVVCHVHMCTCTHMHPIHRECISCTHVHTHVCDFCRGCILCTCAHTHPALQNPCAHQGCPGECTHMCPWLPPPPVHQRCRVGVLFAPLLCRAGFISLQLAAPLLPSRA